MSRNLGRTDCYHCGDAPVLDEAPRPVTAADTGTNYFPQYAGMLVANATCPSCLAKYLAWITTPWSKRHPASEDNSIQDLSYRSSFNDEPGDNDWPLYEIELKRVRVGPFLRPY